MPPVTAERRDPLRSVALVLTLGLHAGVLGGAYLFGGLSPQHEPQLKAAFVDAQLVRFGKPRDLSFLPHKQGRVKTKPPEIKVAKDMKALPRLEKQPKPDDIDPLKKTRAEIFKHLEDDTEGAQATNEGSLTGSRAGTASEAKGDPYILQLVDLIGSHWSIPTTLDENEAAHLSADVCLTITEAGQLASFRIVHGSGNSQFDSSLGAALSTLKVLPPPPDRDIQTPGGPRNLRQLAQRGLLCPTLAKQ